MEEESLLDEPVPSETGEAQRQAEHKGEAVAREVLESGQISAEAVLRALEASHIPWSSTRKNVLPDGEQAVQGMICGLYVFAAKIGISLATTRRPWLTRLLAQFAQLAHPGFPFTSIQVNKNYAARPHVDKNNLGDSFIIGLGDYQGGSLWVQDDAGEAEITLEESVTSMYHYRSGLSYRGVDVDIKSKWQRFDGNRLHFTWPFMGTRFSLVFFTCDRYSHAAPEIQAALLAAGFAFNWSNTELQESLAAKWEAKRLMRKELDQERRAKLQADKEALGRCLARTWNKGWGGDCHQYRHPDGGVFCSSHTKTWATHGRVDGTIPQAKMAEMEKWQRIMLNRGDKPPDPLPLGAVILVDIPGP